MPSKGTPNHPRSDLNAGSVRLPPHQHLLPQHVAMARKGAFDNPRWQQLVTHCPDCKEAALALERWSRLLDHPDPYVACEQITATERLRKLLLLEPSGRLQLVFTTDDYQSWGLCWALIRESFEGRFHHPESYRELAALAVAISRLLDEDCYEPSRCADLRARALANLANAHRQLGHLTIAEETFAEALIWIEGGTGSTGVLAEVLCLQASLERARHRHDKAMELFFDALDFYEMADDMEGAMRAQVGQSNVLLDRRQPAAARDLLLELLPGLRASGVDPQVRTVALYNLATACLELDDFERFDLLIDLLPRTDPLCALRRDGLQAHRLAHGNSQRARAAYRKLLAGYLRLGHGFDAAETACRLIRLDLRAGDPEAARAHAQEMIESLQDDRVRGPAATAILTLARLAKTQAPDEPLIESLQHYLASARSNPELIWEPDAPTRSSSSG